MRRLPGQEAPEDPARQAYDATNLGAQLYNSSQAANGRDNFGVGNKFNSAIVVGGKVFVPTQTGVAEFGLLQ
jgi:hypothetical protein